MNRSLKQYGCTRPFSKDVAPAIAAKNKGFDFVCLEKDEEYYKASVERLKNSKMMHDPSRSKHQGTLGLIRGVIK